MLLLAVVSVVRTASSSQRVGHLMVASMAVFVDALDITIIMLVIIAIMHSMGISVRYSVAVIATPDSERMPTQQRQQIEAPQWLLQVLLVSVHRLRRLPLPGKARHVVLMPQNVKRACLIDGLFLI
jgi:hypothetical protein